MSVQNVPGSDLSVVQLLIALGEEKKTLAVAALIGVVLGVALAFALPSVYTARTTLLPPQNSQPTSLMAASLGSIAASAGVAGVFRTPEELYVGLLKTDSIANAMVEQFKLRDRYGKDTLVDARRELATSTRIASDRRSTLIMVEVDDKEPAFAAQLANAYVAELRKVMTRLAVTDAQQRRKYFEDQTMRAKNALAEAEVAAKRAQEKSGLISLDAETQTTIGAAAQLRGQIVAREVQIQSARPYAGPENPELRRLQSELASLRVQLEKLESGGTNAAGRRPNFDTEALANVRAFRELKYQEAIFGALLQQVQLARADEARDPPLVQQVDVAVAPDKRSKPRRSLVVLGTLAVALVLGLLVAMVRRASRKSSEDAGRDAEWRALRQAWWGGDARREAR